MIAKLQVQQQKQQQLLRTNPKNCSLAKINSSSNSNKNSERHQSYLQTFISRKRRLKINFTESNNIKMMINKQSSAVSADAARCKEDSTILTPVLSSPTSCCCCRRSISNHSCCYESSAKMSQKEQILNQIYPHIREGRRRRRKSNTTILTHNHNHHHHHNPNQLMFRRPSLALFVNSLSFGVILSTLVLCCFVLSEATNESHEHNQNRAVAKLLEPKAEALRGTSSNINNNNNNNNSNNNNNNGNDKYHHHQHHHRHYQQQQDSTLPTTTTSTPTTNNVIIIKYANVSSEDSTRTTGEQDSANQDGLLLSSTQLNVFKLYEPLSVAVIESKFANSIQLFDVSHNQLSTLSKDLFCPLSNEVRQLNISHNLLENFDCLGLISQAGQLCLSELRILDMSYNLIKHLPATGVATLHNLEILNLSHNLIESLDELSLSSLFKLTKLDLSANRIQQLPQRIFHKSISMQVLKLQSNFIETSVSHMLLSGLISLEELNLSYNNISHVSDYAFVDKVNLTIVNLTFNQLTNLRQEALRVTSIKQAVGFKHRLHHNGQYAGVSPKQSHSQSVSAEFLLSSNPFICDCQLDWLRKFQPSAIRRTVLSSTNSNNNNYNNRMQDNDLMLADQAQDQLSSQLMQLTSSNRNPYQNDQPAVILTSSSASIDSSSTNNISEILSNQQLIDSTASASAIATTTTTNQHQQQASNRPMATLLTNGGTSQANNQQQAQLTQLYARIGDLDLIKCTPLFKRNNQRYNQHHHEGQQQQQAYHRSGVSQSRSQAPPDGAHHGHMHHQIRQTDSMINLMAADSSNFLCRYKSHCFALCHCCEFDACDCEMICPSGCNCYYDSTWQTNIIDCSSNNHTVVPDRIPMDVSGLYLDGNNIDSLKPSNLIARKSLKTLYLNSSNLQYIANRTFNGLIELQTLYLHDNMLRSLNGYEFEPLAQLKALYLQSNRLDHISNQTFVYLRSLEVLDLSNNRLTSTNLDLFWLIGHINIRLRQLNIAHNWWSCQCNSVNKFRQILMQKLLNGGVNIGDKNQLRCYYNSTTVGPLILSDGSSSIPAASSSLQLVYASYPISSNQRQQTQLTEINQCSEMIEDRPEINVNPPLIHPTIDTPPSEFPNDPFYRQEPTPSIYNPQPPTLDQTPMYSSPGPVRTDIGTDLSNRSGSERFNTSSMPLTSFILLSFLMVGIIVIAVSIFVFIRQQQSFHQSHHKKSSTASTTSASSSASSTAISSLNGKSTNRGVHDHLHHHTLHNPHHHHLIMNDASGGTNTANISHHLNHPTQHQHSASSQSNIYAALVSPTTGNSTNVNNVTNMSISNNNSTNINSNLYSNSSTTASHHSNSSQNGLANGYPQHWPPQNQLFYNHQSLYGQAYNNGVGAIENHYAINAPSQASYKTASLYNAPNNYHEANSTLGAQHLTHNDWIKLPKVKQFMSKLVNKSLALGGYRSCSRDELSAITSDKIYDAFISYDKRDEGFVMQHLSAELEYGQTQYRIADRFRDLPLPTSAYIAEAITSVIGCSHRTIIVLTENYLASDWCRYELQAALNEASVDKSHKLIAVVLDPKCLQNMDNEMRSLLTNNGASIYQTGQHQQQQQQQQLVQLDTTSDQIQQQQQQQQLVATLTNQSGGNTQVSTQLTTAQLATSRITFINYNERKFWPKIKQLMPIPRPSTQTLTLTTKN